jgi:hypothetical protein
VSIPRPGWLALALCIVMLEGAFPQRASAQWRAEVLPGLRFGPPIRAGFALGVVYGDQAPIAQFAGPVAIAEGGVGGGRVSAGYLLAFPFAAGVEVLGSAVRTWGSPSQIDRKRTLVGGEIRVSFMAVNVGLSAMRTVRSAESDRRTRYYLNIGLGI